MDSRNQVFIILFYVKVYNELEALMVSFDEWSRFCSILAQNSVSVIN